MAFLKALVGGFLGWKAFQGYLRTAKLPTATALSFDDICNRAGFAVESHYVKTEDGYFLKLHRLSGRGKPFLPGKKPILLTHGLAHTSVSFVINQAASPLAFTLADNDYDVWLMNTRGGTLSRAHETLTLNDAKFWDFTAEDIAQKDLPAAIDFVKASSGLPKISCIGHSQGAIALTLLMMSKPEYNDSVNIAVLLNTSGGHFTLGPAAFKCYVSPITHRIFEALNWHYAIDQPGLGIPRLYARFPNLAAKLYKELLDISIAGDSAAHLPVYASHFARGTSLKSIKYLGQHYTRKDPNYYSFDYGVRKNHARYGTATPPMYDYTKIKTKLAVFEGKYDIMLTPYDLDLLLQRLPKESVVFVNKDLPLDHVGVLASKDASYQQDLLKVLSEHA
jgi:pimeloyl-ACP methyl ester carboxylesterase